MALVGPRRSNNGAEGLRTYKVKEPNPMVPGGLRSTISKIWGKTGTTPKLLGSDLRSLGPIHVCPCGSQVFNVMVSFEEYEIVWYFLDAECVSCGNLVVIPTPVDHPEYQK